MGWQRAVHFLILLAVIGVKKTEGITKQNHLKFSSKRNGVENSTFFQFTGFVSCSPNPCENGAQCIKNSLGNARCE